MFIELAPFTKRVLTLLDDPSYAALQLTLMERPDAGAVIKNGGGLRKVRWAPTGKGKSGGVRVIYYWQRADGTIIFATIYAKNEKENLKPTELASLRKELGI